MSSILVLQGPNLNLLGRREPTLYGHETLEHIHNVLRLKATELGHTLNTLQSNQEHTLIERIHATLEDETDLIIFNPAAYTHTSIALRDALLAVETPFIEVHLSNIHRREPFRKTSYFSDVALGVITGFGITSYLCALEAAHQWLLENKVKNIGSQSWI